MPQYNRAELGRLATESGFVRDTFEKVLRLKEINFVAHIEYNYSGQLPGVAQIRIRLGSEYVGKTLYYYLENEDGTLKYVQSATVDNEGYLTVSQSHCSNYVLLDTAVSSNAVQTGDITSVFRYENIVHCRCGGRSRSISDGWRFEKE